MKIRVNVVHEPSKKLLFSFTTEGQVPRVGETVVVELKDDHILGHTSGSLLFTVGQVIWLVTPEAPREVVEIFVGSPQHEPL